MAVGWKTTGFSLWNSVLEKFQQSRPLVLKKTGEKVSIYRKAPNTTPEENRFPDNTSVLKNTVLFAHCRFFCDKKHKKKIFFLLWIENAFNYRSVKIFGTSMDVYEFYKYALDRKKRSKKINRWKLLKNCNIVEVWESPGF